MPTNGCLQSLCRSWPPKTCAKMLQINQMSFLNKKGFQYRLSLFVKKKTDKSFSNPTYTSNFCWNYVFKAGKSSTVSSGLQVPARTRQKGFKTSFSLSHDLLAKPHFYLALQALPYSLQQYWSWDDPGSGRHMGHHFCDANRKPAVFVFRFVPPSKSPTLPAFLNRRWLCIYSDVSSFSTSCMGLEWWIKPNSCFANRDFVCLATSPQVKKVRGRQPSGGLGYLSLCSIRARSSVLYIFSAWKIVLFVGLLMKWTTYTPMYYLHLACERGDWSCRGRRIRYSS